LPVSSPFFWLEMQAGLFAALGVIGGGLLLLALILFVLAFGEARPGLASIPRLQIIQPAALLGTLRQCARSDRAIKLAAGPRHHGSRPALLGMLAVATILGLLAGRRLQQSSRLRATQMSTLGGDRRHNRLV